mgnify:CR=1 FL=1
MKKNWLYEKTVIITGAGSGFGKLLAKKLITKYHCRVIGIGRTAQKLEKVREESGEKFSFCTFDVSIEQNWIDFAAYLTENNILPDILINNAGILPHFEKFELCRAGAVENTIATNFFASVYSFRHISPFLKKSDTPAVINVSSSAALAEVVGTSAYSASKSALASFTKILALENPDMFISLVMPGFSDTDIFRSQNTGDQKQSSLIKKVCSNPDKFTDKLIKKLKKGKKRIVLGIDAHLMSFFGRFFPSLTNKAIRAVLKKSGLEVFSDVFTEK